MYIRRHDPMRIRIRFAKRYRGQSLKSKGIKMRRDAMLYIWWLKILKMRDEEALTRQRILL